MSFQVDTAFVKQFNSTVDLLLQQKGSKLRGTVEEETMTGEEAFFEQVGPVAAQEITTRHGDSPLISTPHDRRRVTLRFFDWGDLIDKIDKVRMLIDPTSPYTRNAVNALGRAIDDVILGGGVSGEGSITSYGDGSSGAMFGTAYTGKSGTTAVSFPSSQVVALNFGGSNSGLTLAKLIEGKRLIKTANVDLDVEELYMAITAKGEADLLNTTQVTSADYNTVKALVNGDVDTFLGITFKRTERLPQSSAGAQHWRYPLYVKSGLKLGVGADIQTQVDRRPDKKFSWYVYVCGGFGATRMEEGKVAEIKGLV
jgi:hypothetical protein